MLRPDRRRSTFEGGTFCLLLDQVIDLDAEKSRLERALGKTRDEVEAIRKRLDNPGFVNRAPSAVVEENRSRLVNSENEEKVYSQALERLNTGG